MNLKSILLVEDDESILSSLEQIFEMENYPVMKARNGLEALNILKKVEQLPGLICLDLMMPIMDGQTFLNELQRAPENAQLKDIPVLIISAAKSKVQGRVVGKLKKPPELEELLEFANKFCTPESDRKTL